MVILLGASAAATPLAPNGKLPPVGAREASPKTRLVSCDPATLARPDGREGNCRSEQGVQVVSAKRGHAVALRDIAVAVSDVSPIDRIRVGIGSIGPLDPAGKSWIVVTCDVKNTSQQAIQFRDEQFELRLGATNVLPHPEATSVVHGSLTRANRRVHAGASAAGTLVFEIPRQETPMLSTGPSAMLFTAPRGDLNFDTLPRHVVGMITLS